MTKTGKKAPASEKPDNLLVAAAKAIGTAAGTVAATVGVSPAPAANAPSKTVGRLPKKNKPRLPRRQKKAALKTVSHARKTS